MTPLFTYRLRQDISNWDGELLQLGMAHPFQSTAFGELWKQKGNRIEYVEIFSGRSPVGKCLVFFDKASISNWYQGPLVKQEYLKDYRPIIMGLGDFLRSRKAIAIIGASTQTVYAKDYYLCNLPEIPGAYEAPFVKLDQDMDAIEKGYERSLKKNLRKCNEANVTVEITKEPSAIGPYLEMLKFHRGRMGMGLPDLHPNLDSMRFFSRPHLGMDLALASIEGKLLAGLGFITFGDLVIEIAAAQSEEYHLRKLPAYELIKVKAIEHYKAKGLKVYDLMGVKRNPDNDKEANIRRFKLKFTESVGEFGSLGLRVLNPIAYAQYRLRNKLKRLARQVLPSRNKVAVVQAG